MFKKQFMNRGWPEMVRNNCGEKGSVEKQSDDANKRETRPEDRT